MKQASLENLNYQFFKDKKRGEGCHGLTTPTKNKTRIVSQIICFTK